MNVCLPKFGSADRALRSVVFIPALVVCLLGCALLPGLALASPARFDGETATWRASDAAAGGALLSARGEVVYRTENPVHAVRSIEPFATGLQLVLWDEETTPGLRTPHYAVFEGSDLLGRVRATDYAVELSDARFEPLTQGAPAFPTTLQARGDNRLFFVQTAVTPLPALQDAIREAGGTVHRYLSHHTMIVEMAPAARNSIAGLSFVRWMAPYHAGHRLDPAIRTRLVDGSLAAEEAGQRYSIMLFERGDQRQQALAETIRAAGGHINILTDKGLRIEATLDAQQLLGVLHDNRVQYVDAWGGPAETDMDQVREVAGADYVETVGGFTGAGVNGEVLDSELRLTHQEWAGLAPIVHSTTANGATPHGTSVASNTFASGTNPAARGIIPDGQPIFFVADEVSHFGGPTSRYTIYEELRDPAGPYRAVFQTSSVGNARTLSYTTLSAEIDDALFLNQVLSTQSQSNAGNQMSRPQAWAKNMVSIGGVRRRGTLTRTDDSWSIPGSGGASIGPAEDGRIKPDLSLFYDSVFSATRTNDTAYTSISGTSFSTPQTAGFFGLLFQMWHEGVWNGHGGAATVFDSRPHMMTAKALMIHHAYRYDWNSGGNNADLDRFKQGWGTADARNLYDTAGETLIIDETEVLAPLGTYTMTVTMDGTEPELKATMAYLDPMGTVGAAVHRVNDLTLRVTSPSNMVYWGNNGLTADNFSTSGGTSNEIDTVENVFVLNPEAGDWTIEVLADEVVADTHAETPAIDADFALVISPVAGGNSSIFSDGFESGDTSVWSHTVN